MLHYSVTENDYTSMVKWALLKKLGTKRTALLKLLLKTVLPIAALVWLFLSVPELPLWARILLVLAALLYAGVAAFQYFFVDYRAQVLLKGAKRSPEAREFWQEHTLEIRKEMLHLSYGKVELEIPCSEVTALESFENITMILHYREVFELVPKSLTESEEWKSFCEQLTNRHEEEVQTSRETVQTDLMRTAPFSAWMDLTHEELAEKFVHMKRLSLRYLCGWSVMMALSLLLSVSFLIYAVLNGDPLILALAILALGVINIRTILIFTPRYYRMVLKSLPAPTENGYLLAIRDKAIWFGTESRTLHCPIENLRKMVRTPEGLYVYFEGQTMLFVLPELADDFVKQLREEQ